MFFIRVGNVDINMDKITHIWYSSLGNVEINLAAQDGNGQTSVILYGEDAQAFKEAWNCGVGVITIYQVD